MSYYVAPPPAVVVQQKNVSTAHVVIAWIICVLTAFYMLPWAIAASRGKSSSISIMLVNLFLGWSVIAWWWCLIWSCLSDPQPVTVVAAPVAVVQPVAQPVAALPMYPQAQAYPQPSYQPQTYPQTAYDPQNHSYPSYPQSAPSYQPSAPSYQPSAPSYQESAQTHLALPQPASAYEPTKPLPSASQWENPYDEQTVLAPQPRDIS